MELSTMTGTGLANGAARGAALADDLSETSPRARETALAAGPAFVKMKRPSGQAAKRPSGQAAKRPSGQAAKRP